MSAAERADAVAALGEHHATGRLTPAEYEARSRRAAGATVRAELEVLFDDLPAPHPDLSSSVPPRRPVHPEWPGGRVGTRVSRVLDATGVLALLVGLPTAIVLTATLGLWWTFLVAVGVAVLAMVLGIAFTTESNHP